MRIVTSRNQQVARDRLRKRPATSAPPSKRSSSSALDGAAAQRAGDHHFRLSERLGHQDARRPCRRPCARPRHAAAGRSENSASRLLRGRHARHAEPRTKPKRPPTRAFAPTTDARAAARTIRNRAACDERAHHARRSRHVAARRAGRGLTRRRAREVADVTGAGDTVIATLAWRWRRAPTWPKPPRSQMPQRGSRSASSDPRRSPSMNCSRR